MILTGKGWQYVLRLNVVRDWYQWLTVVKVHRKYLVKFVTG